MTGLIITIALCIILAAVAAILTGKNVKNYKTKKLLLLIAPLLTIACHYSSLLYHLIGHSINPEKITTALQFLYGNPNLVLPIYPCNVVMWSCLIYGLLNKDDSKLFKVLTDFIFLFGVVAALGGIIANGDYFNAAVAKDYDIYKSAIAHGFMLYNIFLIPALGFFKLETIKNTIRTTIGVAVMGIVGLYCSLLVLIIGSKDMAISWNAMFLWRTPIDAISILRFHIVIPIFVVVLFGVLTLVEVIKLPKGERWFNKIKKQ